MGNAQNKKKGDYIQTIKNKQIAKTWKLKKCENGQNTKTGKWSKHRNVRTEKTQQDKMQICENGQNARMCKRVKLQT